MSRRKEEILGTLLVAVTPLLSFPLSWLPQAVAQNRFAVVLPVGVVLFVLLLLAAAWSLFTGATPIVLPRKVVGPFILLAASWLVSIRFSDRPHISVAMLAALLSNAAVLLLATRFPPTGARRLAWWWLTAASVVAGNALLRWGSESELLSTIGNRNFLAAYLAAALVMGVALWDWRAAMVCALLVVGLLLCHSRGAWLGLACVGLFWFVAGAGWPRLAVRLFVTGLVVVAATVGLRGYLTQHWQTEVRPVIWKSTARMIATRPLIGHGLGTFVTEYPRFRLPEYFRRRSATNVTDHAHNELLEIAAEQGLLGLVATLWLWGAAFAHGLRSCRADKFRWGLVGATGVLVVHGLLDVGLRYPPNQTLLWFLLGLLLADGGKTRSELTIPAQSRFVRRVLAVACVTVAGWVLLAAVIQPMRADVWERRARLSEARGDFDGAVTAAIRALDLSPFRLSIRYLLAGALAQSTAPAGRQLAIEECLRLEELAPDYADVTFNLGQLYMSAGEPGKALPYLRRAFKINPYDAARRTALTDALRLAGESAR
jgi:O-antigen ligase